MSDIVCYEDNNTYYIRVKNYHNIDDDSQITVPFDEDLSVLVGLIKENGARQVQCIGANLSKRAFDAEEAETFMDVYDFRFFSKGEENIIVPPIEGYVELSADYNIDGYLLMIIRLKPPCASIGDQIEAMQDFIDEEELMMEMDDDFPFECPFRTVKGKDRDKSLLDIFLERLQDEESVESIIEALKSIEPYAMEDGSRLEQSDRMEDYTEFYEYFMDHFSDNEILLQQLQDTMEEAPLVLQIGSYMYEKAMMENALQMEGVLTEDEKKTLERLLSYIADKDCFREVTIVMGDTSGYEFEMDSSMTGEELEERTQHLRAALIEFILGEGMLCVGFYDENMGKTVVNGFYSDDGTVTKMTPAELKHTLNLEKDVEEQVLLQIAFIDL